MVFMLYVCMDILPCQGEDIPGASVGFQLSIKVLLNPNSKGRLRLCHRRTDRGPPLSLQIWSWCRHFSSFSSNGRMNGVQRIISEQSIPVCLYYFEFISNKDDSGTQRVLVQNRKGFVKELCTGIICIFQRPQRERGILKLYFRLRLYCLSV